MAKLSTTKENLGMSNTLTESTVVEMVNRLNPKSPYYTKNNRVGPNFALLLGAGASFESGVPTAEDMTREFVARIAAVECPHLKNLRSQEKWLRTAGIFQNRQGKYGKLFERCFPKAVDRREFIELQVEGKSPSLGYIALANLIAKGVIDAIITTNFDDLIYHACTTYTDIRPIVFSLGGFMSEISSVINRPKVLKIHGDFLFSDLKNIPGETNLPDVNMSNQVQRILEFYKGIVVIGYSGNDKSVMELLNKIPQGKYVFWCVLRQEKVNKDIENFLREKKGNIVRIEGFDKLMNEIRNSIGIDDRFIFELFEKRFETLKSELRKFNPKGLLDFDYETAVVLFKKGWESHLNGENIKAEEYYRAAIEKAPQYSNAYSNLAVLLLYQDKQLVEAEDYLKKAIEANPNYASAYNNLGVLFSRMNRWEEAYNEFKQATEMNPTIANFFLSVASASKVLGRMNEFVHFLEQAQNLALEDDYYLFAGIAALQDNYDECLRNLAIAIRKKPIDRLNAGIDPEFNNIRLNPNFQKLVIK